MKQRSLRICYFGTYSTGEYYPRNTVIISALRKAGAEVVECHSPLFEGCEEKRRAARGKLFLFVVLVRLVMCHLLLTIKFFRTGPADVVIVGYGGICDVLLARLLCTIRRRPVVYDAFFSVYDTVVQDRQLCNAKSMKARLLWWYDYLTCRCADLVLLDTHAHIDYFVREVGLPHSTFARVWVGTDKQGFDIPNHEPHKDVSEFRVLFWGTFVPLHGLDTIVSAAQKLSSDDRVNFTIIGNGQLEQEIRALADSQPCANVQFLPPMSYEDTVQRITSADLCLGVFGTTDKTYRVIPCKVYESLYFGKPLITGDTPAARELLTHNENAYLVPCGDANALSRAILRLSEDVALRQRLAEGARALFDDECSQEIIGRELTVALNRLVVQRTPREHACKEPTETAPITSAASNANPSSVAQPHQSSRSGCA